MERLTYRPEDQWGNPTNSALPSPLYSYHEDKTRKAILYKLAEYEDLEEQGRLITLPCKVGTRIYRIVPDFSVCWPDPVKYKVIWDTFKLSDFYEFGKKVFLTREEAEEALKNK